MVGEVSVTFPLLHKLSTNMWLLDFTLTDLKKNGIYKNDTCSNYSRSWGRGIRESSVSELKYDIFHTL
jgi:hypothetical protein